MQLIADFFPATVTWALLSKAFLSLLVVVDPPAVGILYLGLVKHVSPAARWAMAVRGHIVAFFVLAAFAVFGMKILSALGIGVAAFRIASGFMLFLVGLEMTISKRNARRREGAEKALQEAEEDISVFPLGVPLIAGPGAIAAVLLPAAETGGAPAESLAMLAVVAVVLGISILTFWVILKFQRLQKNEVIEEVLTRLLGLLLAALAAQFMIDGVKQAFGLD